MCLGELGEVCFHLLLIASRHWMLCVQFCNLRECEVVVVRAFIIEVFKMSVQSFEEPCFSWP